MKIITNFKDYYLPYRTHDGPTIELNVNGGPSKREQFALMTKNNVVCAPSGRFEDLIGTYWPIEDIFIERCVVYDDESAHCGEGKRLSERQMEEFNRSSGKFSSAYVGDWTKPALSWRRLQIGNHCIWIEYVSREDWRSNCGDSECEVIGVDWHSKDSPNPFSCLPLYAIDYVIGKNGMYAIDFNVCPGIFNSGVEKIVSGKESYGYLEDWMVLTDSKYYCSDEGWKNV